jgi:hypothetical protein
MYVTCKAYLHYHADVATSLQPLIYNSVEWSQAENGDPLVCVAGTSQIKILNVITGDLVTVRLSAYMPGSGCFTDQT